MGFLGLFKKKEQRNVVNDAVDLEKLERIFGTDFRFARSFSSKSAMSLSVVYSCVELISNALAQMEIQVKSVSTKGKLEQIQLNRIFKKNTITKFNLIKQMISDMLLYGNGYAYIERATDGMIVGLTYLPGDQVTIYYNDITREFYFMYKGLKIEDKDIIHLYKNSYDGITGIPVLKFAARSISLANNAEDSAADYFASGLNINAIIHATAPMTAHQAKQAVDSINTLSFDKQMGTGKIKFLPFDLKLEPISQNAEEAQLTDTRLFNVQDIARFFNIPVSMLLDNTRNTAEINLQFLTQCLAPYIVMIEDELNMKLITNEDLYFDLDERALLRADLQSTANYYQTLVNAGIMSIGEAREALGLKVMEGTDELIIPYTKIEDNTISDKNNEIQEEEQ